MIKKTKQTVSQQQIQQQNVAQQVPQVIPKQIKMENPKKLGKQQNGNSQLQQQNQQEKANNISFNPESGQKIRKQNSNLILPSIYRANNFQALQKRRQSSASRENIHFQANKKGDDDDENLSESENRFIPQQRRMQRPQSFIMKNKDKKADAALSQNMPPKIKILKIKSHLIGKQHSNNNSPTISDKSQQYYDEILHNTQTTKKLEKIKFNPWKRSEEKQEENYEKLLIQLNDLKKKHKLQMEQYQQKQQQESDDPKIHHIQLQHQQQLLENKDNASSTPQSQPENKQNYESFQQVLKHNSLESGVQQDKLADNQSKVSNSSSQKEEKSILEQIPIQEQAQNENIDRNIWKRKKINDRNQIMEECSSIERELYQINFLHNKNQKAINEYINTQNSLLKLNIQMRKQNMTPSNQPTKDDNN